MFEQHGQPAGIFAPYFNRNIAAGSATCEIRLDVLRLDGDSAAPQLT
jgi:hypothetical protein